jgi:hypothetical protein
MAPPAGSPDGAPAPVQKRPTRKRAERYQTGDRADGAECRQAAAGLGTNGPGPARKQWVQTAAAADEDDAGGGGARGSAGPAATSPGKCGAPA